MADMLFKNMNLEERVAFKACAKANNMTGKEYFRASIVKAMKDNNITRKYVISLVEKQKAKK